jgi:hypothetical protein
MIPKYYNGDENDLDTCHFMVKELPNFGRDDNLIFKFLINTKFVCISRRQVIIIMRLII